MSPTGDAWTDEMLKRRALTSLVAGKPAIARGRSRYGRASKGRGRTGKMSKTEQQYSEHLESQKLAGEITDWWFEPMSLRLAEGSRYEPDFLVQLPDDSLVFHDTKSGVQAFDAHGVTKMKVAADKFPFKFIKVVKRAKKLGGGWELTELN